MVLHSLLQLGPLEKYKIHAARFNGVHQPLDVFVKDPNDWLLWNSWRGNKNDFNRDLVLSLIRFYPEPDTWLFGGIFKILYRASEQNAHSYQIELLNQGKELIGRLKLTSSLPRGRALNLETFSPQLRISEILKESYKGEPFCGYENISLDFSMLDIIFKNRRIDWQTALQNIAGIYLIADKKTGKNYIGSAYGSTGIYSRWQQYLLSGHGGNKLMIDNSAIDYLYAIENFKITLIEWYPAKVEDKFIFSRENFWKKALLTRQYGYNSN